MKRDILFLHCQDGHKWKFVGGAACCCEDVGGGDCCSIPVHRCENCGDYDYGDNDGAREIKLECKRDRPDSATNGDRG